MKKSIFILMAVVLGMTACNEKQITKAGDDNFDTSSISVEDATWPKLKIKTGRPEIIVAGESVEDCSGLGKCGPCAAICITVEWKNKNNSLTFADGWREVAANLNGSQMILSFIDQAEIDNGDGTTTFESDFNIGSEVSTLLGFNNVIILAGNYPIDYSSNPKGAVTVLVSTN